jgi:signal transduction histidine kinase
MNSFWWFVLSGFILILAVGVVIIAARRQRFVHAGKSNHDKNLNQVNVLAQELVHEIRNPLNSINLNLQLLEEDLTEGQGNADDLQQRVRRIRGEVEHLDRILTDFRRYAQLAPVTVETCDLAMLIEEVLDFNEPEAQRQNIQVIHEIQELPSIELDREQFKQALLNLILNANQAMEDGGQLTVRAKPLNGQIQIDVEDTGRGIQPDRIDKIFDLFFSTKEDGTGVGLTIVKQVIEGHDGYVSVESVPDQGTKFSILLPAK